MKTPIDFNKTDEYSKPIDFSGIKAASQQNIETILKHWMPGGKVVGAEYVTGNKHGGEGNSCKTNINTCCGADFATGETWGDAISMVAAIESCAMYEAARKLKTFLAITPPMNSTMRQPNIDRHAEGRKHALALWADSKPCPHNHPYLLMKQIMPSQDIRYHFETGNIIIPLFDEMGVMHSVQRIDEKGNKKLNQYGKLSGNFHIIDSNKNNDIIFICEGYATAQTVAMATGKTTVMAVSTTNLIYVAEKISKLFPESKLIFAADNDQEKEGNPGITAAKKAVQYIGKGEVIAPPFVSKSGDWNDYAIEFGDVACRELLLPIIIDLNFANASIPEFLVEDIIETPTLGMIFGASGSGKSFFALDIMFHLACDLPWRGHPVKSGVVIYICGEGRHAIPRRKRAWEMSTGVSIPNGKFMISNVNMDFSPDCLKHIHGAIDSITKEHGKPAIIVIDTLSRLLPAGADENSSKDVMLFLSECDKLKSKYNCVVSIIHHTGHSDSSRERARGSSAMRGTMDWEIYISPSHKVESKKTKDIEPFPSFSFDLLPVQYGNNVHEKSCVVKYLADETVVEEIESPYATMSKSALFEAITQDGIDDIRCCEKTWRNAFYEKIRAMSPSITSRTVYHHFKQQLDALTAKGMVKIEKHMAVVTRSFVDEYLSRNMFSHLFHKKEVP